MKNKKLFLAVALLTTLSGALAGDKKSNSNDKDSGFFYGIHKFFHKLFRRDKNDRNEKDVKKKTTSEKSSNKKR